MTEDAISRKAVIDTLDNMDKALDTERTVEEYKALLIECYKVLPPVTPKQRTGHWIEYTRVLIPEPINKWEQAWYCSECGYGNQECEDGGAWLEWKYCPNCGCRMIEPQESEE